MKKFIKEEHVFKITVISGNQNKDGIIKCRDGHELGDTYLSEYGCPKDFCPKSILRLYPLMEAACSGSDYRLLGGSCKDVVNFRLEVIKK